MTTVVFDYDKKEIGYDSRITCSDVIVTDGFNKRIDKDGKVFILAGTVPDYEGFVSGYPDRPDSDLECQALMVSDGNVYRVYISNDKYVHDKLTYNDAIGTGGQYALCALDFGCDVRGAVRYAYTKDIYSGGTENVYKVVDYE